MVVIFTFDDGRKDAFNASVVLKSFGLNGTFFITTGFVDGSYHTNDFGKNRKPLSKQEILEMEGMGMEIASHGDKHVMEEKDFAISKQKIDGWINNKGKIGFSVPFSKYTEESIKHFITEDIKYIRIGRNKKCYSFSNKIKYLLNLFIPIQPFFNSFNRFNIITNDNYDKYILCSVVVNKSTKPKQIINFLKGLKNVECYVIFMFHSIVESPTNKWEYGLSNFSNILKWCKDEKISSLTMNEFVNKMENNYEKK